MTIAERINNVAIIIDTLKSNKNITQKEAYTYWSSDEVQSLKGALDEDEIMDPPKFKAAVGVTGEFADFLFSRMSQSTYSDFL